jgi:DNA-binding NarL/FixJ family response regulator
MSTSNAGSKGSSEVPQREQKAAQLNDTIEGLPESGSGTRAQGVLKSRDPIVIIDIRLLPRECLARVLSTECDVPVVCYSTIDEWLEQGQAMSASLLVLCQCGRSKADAIKEVERLSELSEQIGAGPAVILSDNEDPDLIVQMLGKNVRGYVPTSLSINVAVQAMELARAGGVFVPASSLIAAHRVPEGAASAMQKTNGLFTARQAAVVDALRRGKANKIIAYELKMRESTVKVHVRNIMKKLHATNRTEVAYMANRLFNGEELVG